MSRMSPRLDRLYPRMPVISFGLSAVILLLAVTWFAEFACCFSLTEEGVFWGRWSGPYYFALAVYLASLITTLLGTVDALVFPRLKTWLQLAPGLTLLVIFFWLVLPVLLRSTYT